MRPGYKQTAVGVIPAEWRIFPLADLAHIKTGKRNNEDKVIDGDYPFFVRSEVVERINSYSYEGEAILVPGEGRIGDIFHYVNGRFDVHQRVYAITQFRVDCHAQYLHRYMAQRFGAWAMQNTVKATVDSLRLPTFQHFLVPLPPPPEQRAIAETLSDIDALLAGLDRLIAKKRDLKQAAMQQLLTGQTRLPGFKGEWVVKLLGDLGATYGGLTGKSKADFGSGTARYVTFMNVMTNTVIDETTFDSVRVSSAESQNRVERGDLLFNGSSETPEEVALCSLMAGAVPNLYLNSFCFGFRPHKDVQSSGLFLTYYIRSTEGREIMKSLAQGSTRYNLSKNALLAAKVRLPSLAEQTAIATVLSDMDAELAALEARRDKTRSLKQGMMQELLTGRTRLI